jgi:acetolactate synthase-1/3 small subunit
MDINTRPETEHVVSVLIADEPSAHERLTNTLRRRAARVVESSVVTGELPGFARVTVVINGDRKEALYALSQVEKLVDVAEANLLEQGGFLGIQLALIKVHAVGSDQDEASDVFRDVGARLIRLSASSIIAELADTPEVIDSTVQRLSELGEVTELRTGLVAMRL